MSKQTIFNFDKSSILKNWNIVDDEVMGGKSNGSMSISPEGYGVFSGVISLENNGGFSSVRYRFPKTPVKDNSRIHIHLKGDGKSYQFRVKHDRKCKYSYVHKFKSNGEWQEIVISIQKMYPVYRGHKLNRPDFDHNVIEEIMFLIGNKKAESFRLLIDKITLETE